MGYIATLLVTLAYLPQVLVTIEFKKCDMNLGTMMLLFCGMIAWINYALIKLDYPLLVSSILSFLQVSILIYYKVKYDNK